MKRVWIVAAILLAIAAGSAVEHVGAVAAVDDARSVAAASLVVAGAEAEAVVAAETEHDVAAAAGADHVGPGPADDPVGALRPEDGHAPLVTRRRPFTPSSRRAGKVGRPPERAGSAP